VINAEDGYITLGIATDTGDMRQTNAKYARKDCITGKWIVWEVSETLRNPTRVGDYHGGHTVEKEHRILGLGRQAGKGQTDQDLERQVQRDDFTGRVKYTKRIREDKVSNETPRRQVTLSPSWG
jgi:hypothetical protein